MRLCFIVDGRSPIAQNWVRHFVGMDHEVHVISSYPCAPDAIPGAKLEIVPIGLSQLSRIQNDGVVKSDQKKEDISVGVSASQKSTRQTMLAHLRNGRFKFVNRFVSNWLVPVDIYRKRQALRKAIERSKPDLVHALRIAREGVAAAYATPDDIPLIMSVWGNDFTLWAKKNPLRGHQTRMAMRRVNGLHSDCYRDARLATDWDLDASIPTLVVPSGGGIDMTLFHGEYDAAAIRKKYDIPDDAVLAINPRGFAAGVRNDVFFKSLKRVIDVCDNVYFLCINMQDNPVVNEWMGHDSVRSKVRLLPRMPNNELPPLYSAADICVSPTEHDGTPNALLEAMACKCFVVAGYVESIAEWITDGENGLLCDASDESSLANTIIAAIQHPEMWEHGASLNRQLAGERADIRVTIPQAEAFYETILEKHRDSRAR